MVQKQQFEGILNKVEAQVSKYQKHGVWEVQQVMGQKCYVSMVQFEKTELGALVIFDAADKMALEMKLPLLFLQPTSGIYVFRTICLNYLP